MLGGQPSNYLELENYPGFPIIGGYDLMEKFDEYDNRIDQPRNGKAEPWQYQMLKSMECFLYQCDESDEVRDAESFKVVKMMIAALKDYIVSHLPEYQAAEWD